jgi:hypothetical protein
VLEDRLEAVARFAVLRVVDAVAKFAQRIEREFGRAL